MRLRCGVALKLPLRVLFSEADIRQHARHDIGRDTALVVAYCLQSQPLLRSVGPRQVAALPDQVRATI